MLSSLSFIRGARQHNLKNIDLELPRDRLIVTGVSGSGKSSLAFDTIFAAGSAGMLNLSVPMLDQNPPPISSLSTVGTVTEIYDSSLTRI